MTDINRNSAAMKWNKIREILFLLLMFSYIMLRLYNTSWVFLGDIIPGFDTFTSMVEMYAFPIAVGVLYIANLIIDRTYFEIKREAIKFVLFAALAIVSVEHSECLILGTFLLCSDFSSVKNISVTFAAAVLLGTVGVILASQTGWTSDYLVPRMDREAHYFGFAHYAIWARQILFATVLYLISRAKKISVVEFVAFAVIQAVTFYYSTQRLTFVVSIFAVVVFVVFMKCEIIKINNKIIGGLSVSAFPVAMAGTIWVSLIYDKSNELLYKINKMLSGRFRLQKRAFDILDIKPFAQQVHHITDYYFYIDSGYLYALFAFGVVLTAIIIAVFTYMFWRTCKTNNTALFSLIAIVLVYLLVDNPVCDLTSGGIIFMFFPVLLREHFEEKRNIKTD